MHSHAVVEQAWRHYIEAELRLSLIREAPHLAWTLHRLELPMWHWADFLLHLSILNPTLASINPKP